MKADADIGADNKNSHKKACIEQAFIVYEILGYRTKSVCD